MTRLWGPADHRMHTDPTPMGSVRGAGRREWVLDADYTRYHVILVPAADGILIAAEPDRFHGGTWVVLDRPVGYVSEEYVAEKWRVNGGDDLRNLTRLIRAAITQLEETP